MNPSHPTPPPAAHRPGTRVLLAGLDPPGDGDPFLPGPVFASTYRAAGDPSRTPYTYGRHHNPTWSRFERALGELEGGTAVTFASGMAAVTAVFGVALEPGDALVMTSDCYYTARLLADGFFRRSGVEVRKAPTAGDGLARLLPGAKLVWVETPANPGLDVCDVAALVAAARREGVLVAVDNTTATVLGQTPLALGADFSVASDSKALSGHSDLILGHVAVRDPDRAEALLGWRTQLGAIPGPMEVWLAHRSLGTLEMRLERQCANALRIAELLAARPEVHGLRYPGRAGDPSHEIAARQMRYYGPVIGFALPDREHAERFLSACRLVIEATSFGGLHSSAERRARWGGDAVPPGFIRLSAGCEDPEDLLADLTQALDSAAAAGP